MWSIKLPQCETPHYLLPLPINKLNYTQSWKLHKKIYSVVENYTKKSYKMKLIRSMMHLVISGHDYGVELVIRIINDIIWVCCGRCQQLSLI